MLEYLRPWDCSPLVQVSAWGALALYLSGLLRGAGTGFWRAAGFVVGVSLIYGVTQTKLDYLSQYMFFAHRGQHLVLHHLGPFLIALSAPGAVLAAGLPETVRRAFRRPAIRLALVPLRVLYRLVQQPAVAAFLFVGLIYFWLIPEIHFDAMLSNRLYWLMNWSMAVDGLLFWWLVLARACNGPTPWLGFGPRLLMLVLVVPPQILIGAYITFSGSSLFDVYAVCGRAFPIAPITDQQIGGLITWIPAAMMSVLGVVVLLARRLNAADRVDETAPGRAAPAHRVETT